jgi:hypothetical protein
MTLGTLLLALAPSAELLVFGIGGLFLFGAVLGIVVTRAMPGLTFPAIGLLALTGVGPSFVVDVPVAGRVVNLRLADNTRGLQPGGLRRAGLAHRRQPQLTGAPLARTRQQEPWRSQACAACRRRLDDGASGGGVGHGRNPRLRPRAAVAPQILDRARRRVRASCRHRRFG